MRLRVMVVLVLIVCGLPLPALADQWSKTYTVSGRPDLWVSTGDGDVRIDVWDEPRIEARIDTIGYEIGKDFQLIESQSGSRVSIETRFPNVHWGLNIGRRSLVVTLKVPRESNLDIHTGDGDVRVAGARGDLRFRTGDGRIDATEVDGRLEASSGDGRVAVEGRFDLLDVHTGDGSVEVAAKPGSTVASAWSIRTGDGSVTLRLAGDLRANLDTRTGDGHLTLNVPVTISGSVSRSHVRGTLNGGGGTLTVRTGDGSIRLDRYWRRKAGPGVSWPPHEDAGTGIQRRLAPSRNPLRACLSFVGRRATPGGCSGDSRCSPRLAGTAGRSRGTMVPSRTTEARSPGL